MTYSVFGKETNNYDNNELFLSKNGGVSVARFDNPSHPKLSQLTKNMREFFWQPEEVNITKDGNDFSKLTDHEKHIFTSNLKRQILLDSVQGRAPTIFLPHVCNPELENYIIKWAETETIHSESYSYIIRQVYNDPSIIFDQMTEIKEIVDCATSISEAYDKMYSDTIQYELGKISSYQMKESIWNAIMCANILEGVRFYVSFACSWAFTERQPASMEGNGKIIKLIARDENLHLAGTQYLIKSLPKTDKDFETIASKNKQFNENMFIEAVDQEKKWAEYLFQSGTMIGLNEEILSQYVEYIANKRMNNIGFVKPFDIKNNPLPWTQKYIGGADVQFAPQETEITSYTTAINNKSGMGSFDDFVL